MMPTLKIRCPNCGSRLPIDAIGSWVDAYCKNCKQIVRLDKVDVPVLG